MEAAFARRTGEVLGASAVIAFTRGLERGMRGKDVTTLQQRLTDFGYYKGPVTGYYGVLTSAAVRVFQAAHRIETVGRVGPKTLAALNKSVATWMNTGSIFGAVASK